MEILGVGIDDVLMRLYEELPRHLVDTKSSRGNIVAEALGVSLRIGDPRARISRSENRGKAFSALGELLWYLAKSESLEFIEPYIPKYKDDAVEGILEGAYGPRLFSMRGSIDQVANVIRLLQDRPNSKRAVVQLFDAEDIARHKKEVPCTTTLQFFLREGRLALSVAMRSNDAYFGLPHDVFCFTMIQEMIACHLGADLGTYYHYAGSMHVYEGYLERMSEYVSEGHQKAIAMPPMPKGDPFPMINSLLALERRIRRGERLVAANEMPSAYWADIVRLLQVLWEPGRLPELQAEFVDPVYRTFVEGRHQLLRQSDAKERPR